MKCHVKSVGFRSVSVMIAPESKENLILNIF